jgi:hypothetical protein
VVAEAATTTVLPRITGLVAGFVPCRPAASVARLAVTAAQAKRTDDGRYVEAPRDPGRTG